jgi:transposase InsO family protein
VDLVGPRGHPKVLPTCSLSLTEPSATSTVDCANALFQGWVSRFGVLAVITSDRRTQFTSSLWAALCSLIKIQHNQTTAYHPQSKGTVERFHRRLKDALRAKLGQPPPMGPPGSLRSSQGRQRLHTRSGSVRLTTHFTWLIFRLS